MAAVSRAATAMADAVAYYRALLPQEDTAAQAAAKVAAHDTALVARCRDSPCYPAAVWTPTVAAFVEWLKNTSVIGRGRGATDEALCDDRNGQHAPQREWIQSPDNSGGDDDRGGDDEGDTSDNPLLSSDGGGVAGDPNSAASCASNFLRPLECMGIQTHAITTHPENHHLIGCCTRTPPLLQADCRYGDWVFVASMERDVDCIGGIILVERAVHVPTGTGVDLHCDLRCQNTLRRVRALTFSFLQSGETSIEAFLYGVFAGVRRIIDSLSSHGWSVDGDGFSWCSIGHAFDSQKVQRVRRRDGVAVRLTFYGGVLCAVSDKYAFYDPLIDYPPASVYGPDPPLDLGDGNAVSSDDDDQHYSARELYARKQRQWMVTEGHVSPWMATASHSRASDGHRAMAILGHANMPHADMDDVMARINVVADVIAYRYGLTSGRHIKRAFGHEHINGRTCAAALAHKMNATDRAWHLVASRSGIESGEGFIDPTRGLYVNWTVQCDMIVTDAPHTESDSSGHGAHLVAHATHLPFVRFYGHVVSVDRPCGSEATHAAHAMLVLCEREPRQGHAASAPVPGDGERSRIHSLVNLFADSKTDEAITLHPISAYRRANLADTWSGTRLLSVLWEGTSPAPLDPSDPAGALLGAIEWLMDEFDRCGRLFAGRACGADDHA
ncbi:hypothetical protein pneo_cds_683 [Pandoravirus neocaledonia]|uniref:Uncharacterized protein n=1 Tax=Pandoravirus neocaledonia TaxID=2107708 RepID=A0A2U7UD86_9VIRU|nr:hypothetical protein pneo_cds_683 [Pandoravirus neocaledonia]AVK76290.1 hypothetical protein pneo_cds_683 [Pandoravirus neocaledonia]